MPETQMPETHALRLADRISRAILEGEYAPGTRLEEAGLAARHGLSRTPVREALAEVCARGLAERRPYRGVEVVVPDRGALLDRFEALAEVEALCAGLAAHRGRLEDMLALEDCLTRMEGAGPEAYGQLNFDLHTRIHAMVGNPEITRLADGLRLRLEAVRRAQLGRPERLGRSMDEHRLLVGAICNRDAEGAAALMRRHLRSAAAEVLALLDQRAG